MLFAIYVNKYDLLVNLEILGGFAFWAIAGNTINDLKDMDNPNDKETLERTKGYSKKEIGVLVVISLVLGSSLFIKPIVAHLEILLYLILIATMVILYSVALKSIPVLNWVLLGVSHIWFPYFIIKINMGDSAWGFPIIQDFEWFLLICFSFMALSANLIHEIIDEEAITRLSTKYQQVILGSVSIISIILATIALILFINLVIYFFPFVLFPIGVLYIARSPKNLPYGRTTVKDVGIVAGNLFLAFILILILTQ